MNPQTHYFFANNKTKPPYMVAKRDNKSSLHVVDVMALIYMHLVASHQIWL